jgi:hypothetical protein
MQVHAPKAKTGALEAPAAVTAPAPATVALAAPQVLPARN